jgi:transcriptional regulator with XRE-family HTH domain
MYRQTSKFAVPFPAMTERDVLRRAGANLKKIRERLGLSVREVARRGQLVVAERQNRDFSLSRAWINDIEKGRFAPGIFKIVSLSVIYQMTIAEVHALYGIKPGDITKERPLFSLPKTHLLTPPEESIADDAGTAEESDLMLQLEKTNLLSKLVDIWGDVPVPLLRRLGLRRSLYGYIGTKDRTMIPLLPPGTFVQIDARQTRVKKSAAQTATVQSPFARPIYFLDIRTGYACGWCQIEDGVLTLIPHPDSGEPTRTFRYPSEVEVVGRVTGIARNIEEETLALLEEANRRRGTEKK